jgi:cytochrome oxidase assembly protein ShyY1
VRVLLSPRLLGAHLLAVVCVGVAGWLGHWQYDAWRDHRADEQVDRTQLAPVPLAEVMGPDDPFPGNDVGQPVRVSGTWLPDSTVYVSGREHAGTDGYWVVTDLTNGDPSASALPLVRGWVEDVEDAPAPPTGTAEVVAWLQPTEGTGETDPDPTDDVLPQVRTADLVQHLDQDLYGAYGVVDADAAGTNPGTTGLTAADLEQLPDAGRFTAIRNLLYALEWWVFGGFALFIWWRYVRDVTAEREHAPVPDDDPVPSEP